MAVEVQPGHVPTLVQRLGDIRFPSCCFDSTSWFNKKTADRLYKIESRLLGDSLPRGNLQAAPQLDHC